jgi:N-acetylglucosaminyldiphosphoundecaprenol N-acetyl-beta-D-mannosaminyltransferase
MATAPLTPARESFPARANVLGCEIDALDMEATVARCDELIRAGGYAQHVAINAAKLVLLQEDAALRQIVADCALVSADGQAVVWAGRLLGTSLHTRVAGIDLMDRLLARAAERGYQVFILGAREDVLEQAVTRLRDRHEGIDLAYRNGYFTEAETESVCEQIREAHADILLVAISSPHKERFLAEHGPTLGVPFVMGVGGAIDVVAGITRRAPRAWQRLGLEWLYRLLQEPRRLFRRYAVTNAQFALLLARALVSPKGTA